MADPNVMARKSVAEVRQTEYVLSVGEREKLEEALGAHQHVLGAGEAWRNAADGPGAVNLPELRVNRRRLSEQAKQIKETLEKGTAQPIPEKDRDAYAARAKFLESKFKDWLETRAELSARKRADPNWISAMKKAAKRTTIDRKTGRNEIEDAIAEWKYIQRRLDPQNPEAGNLHELRSDR